MAKKQLFSEQELILGLSDFFSGFEIGTMPVGTVPDLMEQESLASEKSEEPEDDYLLNGQKLLTLAKELAPKHRNFSELSKELAEIEFDKTDYSSASRKIAAVFRPLVRSLGDAVCKSDFVNQLHQLLPHIDFDLCTYDEYYENCEDSKPELYAKYNIRIPYEKPYDLTSRRGVAFEDGEKVLYLLCPQLFDNKILIGYQKRKETRESGKYHKRYNHNVVIVDICLSIAYMYMAETVISNFEKEDFTKSVAYEEIALRAGDYFNVGNTICYSRSNIEPEACLPPMDLSNRIVMYQCYNRETEADLIQYLRSKCKKVIVVEYFNPCNLMKETELADTLAEYLPEETLHSLKIKSCEKNFKGHSLLSLVRQIIRMMPLAAPPVFTGRYPALKLMLWDSRHAGFSTAERASMLRYIVSRKGKSLFPYEFTSSGVKEEDEIFMFLFLSISKVLLREIKEIEREKREQTGYAQSFETKKNIPQKILKLMKESVLNERFGYLEYDEMCDTAKISIVNTQLLSFVETYFPDLDLKGVSLRFRRLGNHKANGLYYPFYRCIAVELSHPSSFVHEFGHMLDYTQGGLSNCLNSRAFSKVYEKYVELFDEKLDLAEATAFYKKGGKKSKYNYYTEETEVFARSFEVYITKVLQLDNTIVRNAEEYGENPNVYHMENEEYMELVVDYFDNLPCMADLVAWVRDRDDVNVA